MQRYYVLRLQLELIHVVGIASISFQCKLRCSLGRVFFISVDTEPGGHACETAVLCFLSPATKSMPLLILRRY